MAIHSIAVCVFAEDFSGSASAGPFCFASHTKMYFRIRFCICISFLFFHPAIFHAKNRIFLLARVLHIAVRLGNSRAKQQTSTKEIHHDPNTPHPRRNRIRNNNHQKHPRHITREVLYGNRLPRLHNRIPRILLQQPLLTKETTMPNVIAFLGLIGAFIFTINKTQP